MQVQMYYSRPVISLTAGAVNLVIKNHPLTREACIAILMGSLRRLRL